MKNEAIIKSVLSSLSRVLSRRKIPSDQASFRAVFDRFKNVLDSNNCALETITDMGEKLGGDYLFGIVYIKKAYSLLKKDMVNSLRSFNELTQDRYPRLHEVFEHIDSLITLMVDESTASRRGSCPVLRRDTLGHAADRRRQERSPRRGKKQFAYAGPRRIRHHDSRL